VISARSEPALARRIEDLGVHLDQQPALPAADVAHTLQLGRRAFSHRVCFLADGEHVAAAVLRRRPLASGIAPPSAAVPVFLFPGQGSQRSGAGRQLYAREPVYRDLVDECAERLAPELGLDLLSLLGYGGRADHGVDVREVLRRTAHAQPALFVVGYAAAAPLHVVGHHAGAMLGLS
jgi:acyl transferase domain-containing protein